MNPMTTLTPSEMIDLMRNRHGEKVYGCQGILSVIDGIQLVQDGGVEGLADGYEICKTSIIIELAKYFDNPNQYFED
jgi:hypothetical protein